ADQHAGGQGTPAQGRPSADPRGHAATAPAAGPLCTGVQPGAARAVAERDSREGGDQYRRDAGLITRAHPSPGGPITQAAGTSGQRYRSEAPLGQAGFRQAQAVAEGLHQVLEGPRGFHHLQALLETAAKVLARPLANHLEGDLLLGDQFALGDIQNDLVLLASRHGFLANQAQPSQRNVRSIAQRQVAGRVTHIYSHPFDKRKTAELTHFFGSSRSWKNIMANRPDP